VTSHGGVVVKHIVGVADMKIASQKDDVIVTHGLGSCLGIAVHDPTAGVGGLLHVMMPLSGVNPEKAHDNPFMFVDTGVPEFFRCLYEQGALKSRMVVKVAGGANSQMRATDCFEIGKRNFIMLKKMFWKNGIMIKAQEVGGSDARTMYLEIGSGRVWLSIGGVERQL